MIGIFAFYLGCNFVVIVIPAVAYAAWLGDAVSRGLLALALVDYAVPLRPGRPWVAWCELTRVAEGIRSYFDAECVIEGDFRRDRSHLIVSHPHGLFGAGYGLYAHELRERFGMKPLFTGADVVFMLGPSAFSSNAAAMGFGLFRQNAQPLQVWELAALRAATAAGGG